MYCNYTNTFITIMCVKTEKTDISITTNIFKHYSIRILSNSDVFFTKTSIRIKNIFLTKVTNDLLYLYRLHMFIIKINIVGPILNDSSIDYQYCFYKDKKFFSFFCLIKIYSVIINIFFGCM